MSKILVFDPGNSTGWVLQREDGSIVGGTCGENHQEVAALITQSRPDVVVFETFALYPSKAKSLAWNSFYPCEVIGVIKYMCMEYEISLVSQAPSVKKYSGITKQSAEWLRLKAKIPEATEHTFDSLQHLEYYKRFHKK